MRRRPTLPNDPLWYKDAIIYEARVRAFYDSNGDGIGDFPGLTEKLDYLQELGVTAIWILPFYPSPLKDDGYDISDYTAVHPEVGTLADFRRFLREAHERGIRVITELVLNHTSDQHQWFQRARDAKPGSAHRNFYVWSDNPDRYQDARIIFQDYEPSNWSWDSRAGAYYWHRFFTSQPDLNFDNPQVRKTMLRTMDFWLALGVDGLRLDAVPYLYEREGTNCENLPETHEYLRTVRSHVDLHYRNRMLLAEANQWPEDAVAYLGQGDECHMAFHFPIMPRLFMALQMEDRYPIIDILTDTPAIPETAQWALFLRNHDELTLEMVTDEERDYMYRMYAQDSFARINLGIRRRLAPLLGNNRRKIELMNGLLFSLPGTPIVYYGDEIGMGDNFYLGDRNGVRTPMQWSPDRNAGFSRANPQLLYLPVVSDPEYHYETINVETQQANPSSLLWWMKRIIALRKRFTAFGRGNIQFLTPQNPRVLVFTRSYESQVLLVVANLSRFTQFVDLDLGGYQGMTPRELFGRTRFPPIDGLPYRLTLGPHGFYWFLLEPAEPAQIDHRPLPRISVAGNWETVLQGTARTALEEALGRYLPAQRWFAGKALTLRGISIMEAIPIATELGRAFCTLVRADFSDGDSQVYLVPLIASAGEHARELLRTSPETVVAELLPEPSGEAEPSLLYDALQEPAFSSALLEMIFRRRRSQGEAGQVAGLPAQLMRTWRGDRQTLEPHPLSVEQSNTTVRFGEELILKVFRLIHVGENPDLEISRFLSDKGRFAQTPQLGGHLEYRAGRQEPRTLAIAHRFLPNEGDAWQFTLHELGLYFERTLTDGSEHLPPETGTASLLERAGLELDRETVDFIGPYLEAARQMGQRTAELHLALAGEPKDAAFRGEGLTQIHQRSLYQSFRTHAAQRLTLLRGRMPELPADARDSAEHVLAAEQKILALFRTITAHRIKAQRIRCHGDLHLGQMLFTGRSFVIIDFEGEPARAIGERRIKRSPLLDVAGMVRSFHYAVQTGLLRMGDLAQRGTPRFAILEAWADYWQRVVSATYLRAYLEAAAGAAFLPVAQPDLETLLGVFMLDKALYELGYELNNRPQWVGTPLAGILAILAERGT